MLSSVHYNVMISYYLHSVAQYTLKCQSPVLCGKFAISVTMVTLKQRCIAVHLRKVCFPVIVADVLP